jgi:hypothetical protein
MGRFFNLKPAEHPDVLEHSCVYDDRLGYVRRLYTSSIGWPSLDNRT